MDSSMGIGQTAIAAIKAKRYCVGYNVSEEYAKLAERRMRKYELQPATLIVEPRFRNKDEIFD